MSVVFRNQVAINYEDTETIKWYRGSIGYVEQHFVKAIDFSFNAGMTDFIQAVDKLSTEFEIVLKNFEFVTKVIDFAAVAHTVDYTQIVNEVENNFNVSLTPFQFTARALDFENEARIIAYSQDANKIDRSRGLA